MLPIILAIMTAMCTQIRTLNVASKTTRAFIVLTG